MPVSSLTKKLRGRGSVETNSSQKEDSALPLIAIVGSPNVGKSVLFNLLTGRYVTVSNYPGTTVEVSKGVCQIGKSRYRIVDTPGMYGLNSITDEERVARRLLIEQQPQLVLHMVDAKNLERMLPLTLQLLEAGLPVILILNLIDELEKAGMSVNIPALHKSLDIPIFATACLHGRGVQELKEGIDAHFSRA